MLDPLPPPPPWLVNAVKPYSEALYLPSLPYHIHEVVGAFVLYQTTQSIISPLLSNYLFPNTYSKLNRRTRINWDVHVVSLLQSLVINTAALWVMFTDQERKDMNNSSVERVYGYTGASGLIQALATGYFAWDLVVSARYLNVFGPGILAHAVTALCVFALGFVSIPGTSAILNTETNPFLQRPFCNYYGPVFILYELSTPFLNVHWFCDKLNMTGGKLQWYNGMLLLSVFFGCRLVWGTYNSLRVYQDVWHTMHLELAIRTRAPRAQRVAQFLHLRAKKRSALSRQDIVHHSSIRSHEVHRIWNPGDSPLARPGLPGLQHGSEHAELLLVRQDDRDGAQQVRWET